MMSEYENTRRVRYGELQFVPICEKCGRFIKPDDTIFVNGFDQLKDQPNATCSKCGRTKMIFEGFFEMRLIEQIGA